MSERIDIKPFKNPEESSDKLIYKKSLDKVNNFLKESTPDSNPGNKNKETKGNSLRVNNKGAIESVRKEVLDGYPSEKIVEQEIQLPAQELSVPVKKENKNIFKSIGSFFKRNKNRAMIGLGFLTLASSAKADNGNSAEKELTNNKNTTEFVNTNPGGGGERKVKEVPPGYVKSHTDGKKTYYKKVVGGGELKLAKPGDGKGGVEYENWLKEILKSGKYSPEQLAEMHYISSEAIGEYKKYYTPPKEDVVYTEVEEDKEADPYSAYAKDGESLWNTNRHLMAILSVPVRDTKSITENGNINTSNPEHKVLVRFVDKMGNLTGENIELKTGEIQQYFGTTMTIQSDELMKKLKEGAKKSSTYIATAEDFANNKQ